MSTLKLFECTSAGVANWGKTLMFTVSFEPHDVALFNYNQIQQLLLGRKFNIIIEPILTDAEQKALGDPHEERTDPDGENESI
jgi:hypothetical protein